MKSTYSMCTHNTAPTISVFYKWRTGDVETHVQKWLFWFDIDGLIHIYCEAAI